MSSLFRRDRKPKPKPAKKCKAGKQTSHDVAKLRREGGGTWDVTLGVFGYDEPFRVTMSGSLSQGFAEQTARIIIWRSLRKWGVRAKDVFILDCKRG